MVKRRVHFLLDKNDAVVTIKMERDTYVFLNLLASSISFWLRESFCIPDAAWSTLCVKTLDVDYFQIKHRLFTILEFESMQIFPGGCI